MAIIKKKTWPEYFELIRRGRKKYDLRLADFPIAKGDRLVLEEWNPETRKYTGRKLKRRVSLVHKFNINELYWPPEEIIEKGLQIISFK